MEMDYLCDLTKLNRMKLALIGYGKMGKEIEQIALSRGHEIVCIIDVNNPDAFSSEAFRSAEVAIEFTAPSAAYDNCRKAFDAGVKVVSGSTGWLDAHRSEVEAFCSPEGGGNTLFWSSNFSLGVAIFSAVNRYLAQIMNAFPNYNVAMLEQHHVHKLDAPSGTAITLAEDIIKNIDRKVKWVGDDLTPDAPAPAPTPDELYIHSVRTGEVPGTHVVTYLSDADNIIFMHEAKNRSGFALGAVLAAEYTATHSGLLQMSDLFPFLS
jgi:4-hydroxy-tetrahydrodipicolinate reductase